MLAGECVEEAETDCVDCGEHMKLGVYESGAGFYIGFWCPNCGPYSRESRYFSKRSYAEKALERWLGAQ